MPKNLLAKVLQLSGSDLSQRCREIGVLFWNKQEKSVGRIIEEISEFRRESYERGIYMVISPGILKPYPGTDIAERFKGEYEEHPIYFTRPFENDLWKGNKNLR